MNLGEPLSDAFNKSLSTNLDADLIMFYGLEPVNDMTIPDQVPLVEDNEENNKAADLLEAISDKFNEMPGLVWAIIHSEAGDYYESW